MDQNMQLTEQSEISLTEALPVKGESLPKEGKIGQPYQEPSYWEQQKKNLKKYRWTIWLILPAVAFALVFSYVPMLGILFSFKGASFNLMKGGILENLFTSDWTLTNYADIFVDESFWKAIGNTLVINLIKLVLVFPFSILIAVQLSELKNQALAKVILIIISIPNFLSWAIVIGTWSGLLDSQGGVLNELLVKLAVIDSNYFTMGKDHLFKFFVIFLAAWKGAGWGSIMYYAAIMSIDKSYYESATLDGASKLQKVWYLTLPSILPTIALMLVLNISGLMAAGFEEIWTMMQLGADFDVTQITLDTYLYQISVVNQTNIPFATALGVFNGLIALALMLIGNTITTKTMHRSLW